MNTSKWNLYFEFYVIVQHEGTQNDDDVQQQQQMEHEVVGWTIGVGVRGAK